MQLREKEKLYEHTKQKLLEAQAKLKEKEKKHHRLQGQAAQFDAYMAEKKFLPDELATSNTEVGRLKKELEISQKTATNMQTQPVKSNQSVKLAPLQEKSLDLNKHITDAKSQHKSKLDGCLGQKIDFKQQIADLNRSTGDLKRKLLTMQSESEEKLKQSISTIQSESEEKMKKMKFDLDEKAAENARLMSQINGLQSELATAKEFSDRQAENLVAARAQLLQMQQVIPVVQQSSNRRRSRHSHSRCRSRSPSSSSRL
jgi:chromosome segregation ATPase